MPILTGVDLEALAGSTLAIVGPNGSGKSTLLRANDRAVRLSSGRIHGDTDVWACTPRQRSQPARRRPTTAAGRRRAAVSDIIGTARHTPCIAGTSWRAMRTGRLSPKPWIAARSTTSPRGGSSPSPAVNASASGWPALAHQAPVLLLDEPTNHLDQAPSSNCRNWSGPAAGPG